MWQKIRAYLYWQGRDPATWRGLVMLGTSVTGWKVASPDDKVEIITFVGLFVVGLLGVLWPPQVRMRPPEVSDDSNT